MPPDEPYDEERLEELPEDYDTPFSPTREPKDMIAAPGGISFATSKLDSTHPSTDSNIQLEELYDEGLSGAAEAEEPNARDTVIGYNPRPKITERKVSDMTTTVQHKAATQNIKKAQDTWKGMTHRQHALAQPEGRRRARPGTMGGGEYYHIVVRPKSAFVTFRYQDVGEKGHLQRLAGKRSSGSWSTQAWLISKNDAHVSGNVLVADSKDARDLLMQLGSEPKHEKGDVFTAKDRRNIPEREKPTRAQRTARLENIKKAQAARRAM